MKTYSKKASKRTERAERSSSSDDDRVGKEQPDPRKTPKRTRSSSEKGRKMRRTNKDKPTDTSQKTAPQNRKLGKR